MAFLPISKHDVFVSYAVVDNGQPLGRSQGWITAFVHELELELARLLGRMEYVDLWLDRKRLSCNDVFSSEIEAEVRQSAVMVILYSQGYLESSWCRHEREIFLEAMNYRVDSDRRLFLVEIDRVDSDRRPEELRRINSLRFWEETSDNNPIRFGWPVPNPSWENHQSFYRQVAVLGRHIANQLRRLRLLEEDSKESDRRPSFPSSELTAKPKNVYEELQKSGALNDVFISCKNLDEHGARTRDAEIAAEVYHFLKDKGLSVFLSYFTLEQLGTSDYTRAIDSALESAPVLLAIGTSADHLNANWVRYEWDSFSNAIRSGGKPNGRVFTYIEGMPIRALPWALHQTQTFVHSEASLQRLYNFINKALPPVEADPTKPAISETKFQLLAQQRSDKSDKPKGSSNPMLPAQKPAIFELEPRIFISYAREDYDAAKNFHDHLLTYGLVAWLDTDRLKGGEKWPRELRTQVSEKCWAFISLISKTTEKESTWEGWFIAERNMAMERTIGVADHDEFYFPVVIDESQRPFRNEPDGVENYQWTHAPNGIPPDDFVIKIKEIIARRKKPPGKP